jgi:hypothetical protein
MPAFRIAQLTGESFCRGRSETEPSQKSLGGFTLALMELLRGHKFKLFDHDLFELI